VTASSALRVILDGNALVSNWRWLAARSGPAACGAAVKADGYGLGVAEVVKRLAAAGCRDFFVATWAEAERLSALPEGCSLSVLHGLREADLPAAKTTPARPVLNSPEQVARWRSLSPGASCDVMVDTGMNRLGLTPEQALSGMLDGLVIDTLMSHLACSDDSAHPMNDAQCKAFSVLRQRITARRYSLANSAGICAGERYAFDLTRPGISLYGGVQRPEAEGHIRPVVQPEAEVLQLREVPAGATIGYGATYTAPHALRVAILNLGYADGYLRSFAGNGTVWADGVECPLLGRVSMDLIAIDVTAADVREGDWLRIDYQLQNASAATGLSQYELLTGLGSRYQRRWT
jgi:alanine racemase